MNNPYHLMQVEKEEQLLKSLNDLTNWHMEHSLEYSNIIHKMHNYEQAKTIEDVPFLPVQLFKLLNLKSIPDEDVFKVLTSSGTSGQQVSKIYLDRETATAQTKALVEVMSPLLGKKRMPMIILDTKSVLKNRQSFSARGAGIVGFSNFGRKHFYALNDDMSLDLEGLENFIHEYKGQDILLFGFTFMVWEYVYKQLIKQNKQLNIENGILIHGGGWKKLKDEAVDAATFNAQLKQVLGIKKVHNYYGMVEQVGSIFVECSEGHLHAPSYADIIIRDPLTYEVMDINNRGLIQVVSTLPKSYPGHSLLTEDVGEIKGIDTCLCGWKGKYFAVYGRLEKSEIRGCSDTFSKEG